MPGPYRLKLTKLSFLSSVDHPAQGEGAMALLLKSKGAVSLTAKVAKTNDALGLVFGYAFSSSLDGGQTPHVDYQNDAIDPDFLKTAMEFVEGGGATDVNHDGDQDGRIVFAWPLLPEINKALGIDAKTVGLAVAIKPSAETYKRFQSGELQGFSIAGMGERAPLAKQMPSGKCTAGHAMPIDKATCPDCGAKMAYKRLDVAKFADGSFRVLKESVLTSETDGHVHAIDIDDPSTAWMDMYSTSYQTLEGAENGHAHSWTFDETTGVITIGADSGHSHTVAATVPADALAAYAAIDAARDAENLAVPTPITDEESSGKVSVTVIAARNSTPATQVNHGDHMDELKKQLAEAVAKLATMTASAQRAERIAKMSGAHKTHFDTLTGEDAEAFLAKSASERDGIVAEIAKRDSALGEVVYTSLAGEVFTKRDDARLVAAVKRGDDVEKQRDLELVSAIAKSHLGNLAGDDEVHQYIVSCLRKGGDAAKTEKALTAAKGWNALGQDAKKARGFNPGADATDGDPLEAFNAAAAEYAKKNDIKNPDLAIEKFLSTADGRALKSAYDATRAFNQPGGR